MFSVLLRVGVAAAAILAVAWALPPIDAPGPSGMVRVPGGEYRMGFSDGAEDERPVHPVVLDSFWIDRHEVTNRQFAEFVRATGWVTRAERDGHLWCYLEGADRFRLVSGADWRNPFGPGSAVDERLDHPVVCVSWNDARAYAEWAGKRLPTEAEWEYAARAGDHGHLTAIAAAANVWQGTWPERNELADGFFYTSPVMRFAANPLGVHDMIGNVWEWCSDWYAGDYYERSPAANPSGPDTGDRRVARGGSWFCSVNYCGAYSTNFRGASPPGRAFNNVGFRCAKDIDRKTP